MELYHYTCDHCASILRRCGVLEPFAQVSLPGHPVLAWLTDLDRPDAAGLGLTSDYITCDRTRHRFRAKQLAGIVPWREWSFRHSLPLDVVDYLQHDRRPSHWFVSERPVIVVADPIVERLSTVDSHRESRGESRESPPHDVT